MAEALPDFLVDYFARRQEARADAVNEVLTGLTERERGLVRDAAVMGYVRGSFQSRDEEVPLDATIVANVVYSCLHQAELYPTITGYVPVPLCTECGHAEDEHSEGNDPVSPGTCAACEDEDDVIHDFQPPSN
ncbi:hypothetical protein ACIRF8_15250 [Streptomyces sp. NPDC102406]|uniref:hypothetical protein n=1 Tax=Streptomyces sp. NPDC102406 TaxID=3366171 RepID=UPI00380C661B